MANMRDVAKLWAGGQMLQIATSHQPQGLGAKLFNVNNSPSPLVAPQPTRSGFRVRHDDGERYSLDQALMNIVQPANAVDRTGAFALLAERERLARMAELMRTRMGLRGQRDMAGAWPLAIHA